jgi:hypothetical protein
LKKLIDPACQRNMLFAFDGKEYGPALNIDNSLRMYEGKARKLAFKVSLRPTLIMQPST